MTAKDLTPETVEAGGDRVLPGGWYTLWVIVSMIFFGAVSRQVLTVAAAPMAASLGLSDGELGMVQGLAFALFSVVAVYPIAWAADRFDRRIIVGVCVTACAIGAVSCAFAHNFIQLFLAAIAIASVDCGLYSIFTSFSPDLFKGRKRLLANSIIFIASVASIAVGLAFGGSAISLLDSVHDTMPPALQAFESWRLAFFLVALPAPVLLTALAFTRLRHGGAERKVPEGGKDHEAERFWPFLMQNSVAVAVIVSGLAFYALGFNGYLTWLPVVTTRLFGATPAEIGISMGIALAAATIIGVPAGTIIVRRMIDRMGELATLRFFAIVVLMLTPAMLLFLWASKAWQMFVLFTAVLTGASAIGCMVFTLLQDMAPPALRARMMALWNIMFALIGGNAPTIIGWISGALGNDPRILLVILTCVSLLSWVLAAILFRLAERPFELLLRRIALSEADTASAPPLGDSASNSKAADL